MGSSLASQGAAPVFLEIPNGTNVIMAQGVRSPQATYEAFSPSTFYRLAEITLAAPTSATYYLAVFDAARGGDFSIAVGNRETFILMEWVMIPFKLVGIYQWEWQSQLFLFAPMVTLVAIGLILIWKMSNGITLFGLVGSVAGFMFLGTALTTLAQTFFVLSYTQFVPEAAITLVFIMILALLGWATLRQTLRRKKAVDRRARIYVAVFGALAIFAWAGLLVRPAMAILASVLPSGRRS